jgi:hypothetical protein
LLSAGIPKAKAEIYAAKFEEQDIETVDVLLRLKAKDFKELGVTIGHRDSIQTQAQHTMNTVHEREDETSTESCESKDKEPKLQCTACWEEYSPQDVVSCSAVENSHNFCSDCTDLFVKELLASDFTLPIKCSACQEGETGLLDPVQISSHLKEDKTRNIFQKRYVLGSRKICLPPFLPSLLLFYLCPHFHFHLPFIYLSLLFKSLFVLWTNPLPACAHRPCVN